MVQLKISMNIGNNIWLIASAAMHKFNLGEGANFVIGNLKNNKDTTEIGQLKA